MKIGQVVDVRLYGGMIAPRRVIADHGDVVVICSEEEYQAAKDDEREPRGLGFPREDIINPVNPPAKKTTSI